MGIIFANEQTIHRMRAMGIFDEHDLFEIPLNVEVDPRVADHTDLSVFVSDTLFVASCIYESFMARWDTMLNARPSYVVCCTMALKQDYPFDVSLNAVKLENHFFHKLAYTEPKLLASMTCEKVDVKQGYTRCSTMVIGGNAVITEDKGLAKTYQTYGYEVLIVDKGHVELPGFKYGFFGGSGGVIEDKLVLNGALKHHPNGIAIAAFVHRHGMKIIELHDAPLVDCGSILYFS